MDLREVAAASFELAAEQGRNAKVQRLTELFSRAAPTELPIVIAWLSGDLPQGRIGLGWAAIQKAIEGIDGALEGPLSVAEVDAEFAAIAIERGAGSTGRKLLRFTDLLRRSAPQARQFLLGLVSGSLRQGALEGLVMSAVARAFGVAETKVRRAAMLAGSLPLVGNALQSGEAGLAAFSIELMRPVSPMLADTAEELESVVLLESLVEPKLDGARVQIHKRGDEVRCFSRAKNDVTIALPEVVAAVMALPSESLVLDGEVIALAGERPLPFQTTMRRFGRRLGVEASMAELPLTTFIFDMLLVDGRELLDEPLSERRQRIEALLPAAGPLRRTQALWRPSQKEADRFLAETLARGDEGLMVKRLDGTYQAGQRGGHWLKLKPAKTLDLVVIAVEQGSGRRAQWLSNLHLAARDETDGEVRWVMLGKTFKGMSDALLEWQTQALSALEVAREGHVVHVRPELVVEIAFQELEASSRYPDGVALRFARVKGYRPDKRPEEADTITTVRSLFAAQRA